MSWINRPLIFTLTLMLMACQTPKPSKGQSSTSAVQKRVSTHRTCWQNVSLGKTPKTFILATSANTGNLRLTNQDSQQFMAAVQNRYQVPKAQTCLLQEVYRAEFEAALKDLKPRLKSDDRVIIFFSGHGSYVKDKNGDETTDGLDEVLVTLDIKNLTMPRRREVVTDDDLIQWVNAWPTQRVITFIDACYSSGMYMGNMTADSARRKFFARGQLGSSPRPLIRGTTQMTGGFTPLNGVIFAAASEHQQAWEDKAGGIFTTSFLQVLNRHPRANLKKIFDNTVALMKRSNRSPKPQDPEIIGNLQLVTPN